jgi:hypothetical protein
MLKKLALGSAIALCMTILNGTARADNIPIANPSFEEITGTLNVPCGTGCAYNGGPIPGWSVISGGSWQPGSYFTSVPDGKLIGFVNATRSLSQTLTGDSVLTNSVYTLSVFVGERSDGTSGMYTLSLDTILGGVTTTLCSVSGDAATSIARGTFQLKSCSYPSGSSVPSGDLFLNLTANSGQLDVDNVSLTVEPATGVPEPSSILLLGTGMLFVFSTLIVRRKKELQLTA